MVFGMDVGATVSSPLEFRTAGSQDRRIAGSQDRFFFQCTSYGYKRFPRFWKSDFGFRFFPGF